MTQSFIFAALDDYLRTALDVLAQWGQWLAEHERLILDAKSDELAQHAISASGLHSDLETLKSRRAQLLEEATSSGFICSNLKQLAQALPEWHSDAQFRQRVRNVEHSMTSLRRLNMAAWLLVSQCSRMVDDTLLLMTHGTALVGAYIDVPHSDMSGGQILDTQM